MKKLILILALAPVLCVAQTSTIFIGTTEHVNPKADKLMHKAFMDFVKVPSDRNWRKANEALYYATLIDYVGEDLQREWQEMLDRFTIDQLVLLDATYDGFHGHTQASFDLYIENMEALINQKLKQ